MFNFKMNFYIDLYIKIVLMNLMHTIKLYKPNIKVCKSRHNHVISEVLSVVCPSSFCNALKVGGGVK